MERCIDTLIGYEDCKGYTIDKDGTLRSYKRYVRDDKTGQYIKTVVDFKIKPKILKGSIDSNGYRYYDFKKSNNKRTCPKAHRLIALAFIENPKKDEYTEINHIDGNKLNNSIENLEWCSRSQNVQHSYDTKLNDVEKYLKGSKNYQWDSNHKNCKPVGKYTENGEFIKKFNSLAMAARDVNGDYSNISKVCSGKSQSAYGFKWKYID